MEYNIHKDNVYNFNKTGFQMSVIFTAKVITRSDQADRLKTTQLSNCEWVTVIETICVCDFVISLLIIFETVMH